MKGMVDRAITELEAAEEARNKAADAFFAAEILGHDAERETKRDAFREAKKRFVAAYRGLLVQTGKAARSKTVYKSLLILDDCLFRAASDMMEEGE